MKRKLLALALSASMILGILPTTAFAADDPPDISRPSGSNTYDDGAAVFDDNILALTNADIGNFIGDWGTQVNCYGTNTATTMGTDGGTNISLGTGGLIINL